MADRRLMVGPVEQGGDLFPRLGRPQGADEAVVPERTGHVLQGAQMIARPVLRRDEQHEHVDGFAVEAVEGDALARNGYGADEALDAVVLGVRDGDAPADAGRAEELALEDGPD